MTPSALTTEEWIAFGKQQRAVDKEYKPVLATWDIYVAFYGATPYAMRDDNGGIVSVNATRFSKRPKKNGWGRYINCYVAYTVPEERRKGYATTLQRYIEGEAQGQGLHRVKSLVMSYAGFRFHQALGHSFWGVNDRNELQVDAPIRDDWSFPDGIPMEARGVANPHLLSEEELLEILQQKPYNQSHQFVKDQFAIRPLQYRWAVR